ncbi:MAG: hypothetical protein ABJA67_02665, partial [Chthonomonadales bacterium]
MKLRSRLLVILICLTALPLASRAQLDPPSPLPIRGAHYPALSPDGKMLCFEYLGDLWVSPAFGGAATRLTVHPAYDAYPRWSPDANWIAYSSNREGNFDIFLIPSKGGSPRQVTFHSADDIVLDWSPDGTSLLFQSARDARYQDLYVLSLKNGRERRLTHDKTSSRYGVFTPDAKSVLYVRGRQEWWRPKYEGSANTDIYSIPVTGGTTTRLTSTNGYESFPMAASMASGGYATYYLAHMGNATNVFRMRTSKPDQITQFTGDDIKNPTISRDGKTLAFEQNFQIWITQI